MLGPPLGGRGASPVLGLHPLLRSSARDPATSARPRDVESPAIVGCHTGEARSQEDRMNGSGNVTELLIAYRDGDREAFDRLVPLLYQDLRKVARAQLRRGRPGATLGTTVLVHEVYLKMADQQRLDAPRPRPLPRDLGARHAPGHRRLRAAPDRSEARRRLGAGSARRGPRAGRSRGALAARRRPGARAARGPQRADGAGSSSAASSPATARRRPQRPSAPRCGPFSATGCAPGPGSRRSSATVPTQPSDARWQQADRILDVRPRPDTIRAAGPHRRAVRRRRSSCASSWSGCSPGARRRTPS